MMAASIWPCSNCWGRPFDTTLRSCCATGVVGRLVECGQNGLGTGMETFASGGQGRAARAAFHKLDTNIRRERRQLPG